MSNLSLPIDCESLSAIIANLKRQIEEINRKINYLNDVIAGKIVLPPGGVSASVQLEAFKKRLAELTTTLQQITNAYNQAVTQFNSISPQKCDKPDTSDCEKKDSSKIFGNCSIPPQIRSSSRLQEEIEALEAQLKHDITQAKVCLGQWNAPLPPGVVPVPVIDVNPPGPSDSDIPIDEDAPWGDMILAEAEARLAQIKNHPCLDDVTKTKIEALFTEIDKGRYKNFTLQGKFKAGDRLKKIFRDSKDKQRERLKKLESDDNDIRKKIAEKESLKLQYEDETSEINVALKKLIFSETTRLVRECFNETPLQYTVETTVSATRGPGAPVEIGPAYSVTKTGDDACVTYDAGSYTMILDTNKALGLLGPGGCALLSDEAKSNGYETGPYWIEPVNITSTITINNNIDIQNCVSNKFYEWVRTNSNALYLVSYTGTTSNRKPIFNILGTITINYCISPPAAE